MRQLLNNVKTDIGELHVSILERNQGQVKMDAEQFIDLIREKLATTLDYFNG